MTTERPTTLLAELTHRCPLHCPYCSNPARPAPGRERDRHRGLEAGVHPGARAGRAAAGPLGRRAARPEGPGGARHARPEPGPLHHARDLGARAHPEARRGAPDGRPRAHPGVGAGRGPRDGRADRGRELGQAEAGGHRAGEGAGLRVLDQRGAPPRQPRPHRRDHRPRRRLGRRPPRARQHAVLRLGAQEPGDAHAQPRAGAGGPGDRPGPDAALQGADADHLRAPRLLRGAAQGVLRRLGTLLHRGVARRQGAALPRRVRRSRRSSCRACGTIRSTGSGTSRPPSRPSAATRG